MFSETPKLPEKPEEPKPDRVYEYLELLEVEPAPYTSQETKKFREEEFRPWHDSMSAEEKERMNKLTTIKAQVIENERKEEFDIKDEIDPKKVEFDRLLDIAAHGGIQRIQAETPNFENVKSKNEKIALEKIHRLGRIINELLAEIELLRREKAELEKPK